MPRHLARILYIWFSGTLTVSKEDYSVDLKNIGTIKSWIARQDKLSVHIVCETDADIQAMPYITKLFTVPITPVDLRGIGQGSPDWARFVIWCEENLNSVQAMCIVPGLVNEVISLHSKRIHVRFYGVETLDEKGL
jgi:hypothetical protein